MAALNGKENSIDNDAVLKLKLETAAIVENIVRNLDAKISTSRDFKILSHSILQREAMIRHLQYILANQSEASKPKLVNQEQQTFPQVDDSIDTSPNRMTFPLKPSRMLILLPLPNLIQKSLYQSRILRPRLMKIKLFSQT